MNPDTIGALFLATIAAGIVVGCSLVAFRQYTARRADDMLDTLVDLPPFVDYLFESPEFVDSTPIYTATIQHIAAMEAANIDDDWADMNNGGWFRC
jgi:hypothetical protein